MPLNLTITIPSSVTPERREQLDTILQNCMRMRKIPGTVTVNTTIVTIDGCSDTARGAIKKICKVAFETDEVEIFG